MKTCIPDSYPRLVEIGKATYHVVFMDNLPKKILGMCDPRNKLILISSKQDAEEMHATYWHEVLHAIEIEFNCSLGHPRIRKLEWAIVQVLAQFPSEHKEPASEKPVRK